MYILEVNLCRVGFWTRIINQITQFYLKHFSSEIEKCVGILLRKCIYGFGTCSKSKSIYTLIGLKYFQLEYNYYNQLKRKLFD